MDFDFKKVVEELKMRRKIFVSEADFQLEMALVIKKLYPESRVRLEFCPIFDPNMHIDILVVLGGKWYPIELKYKTKACEMCIDDEAFNLKTHGARDVGSYLYLKDIQRIEKDKENMPEFKRGYTMLLTNDLHYLLGARNNDCKFAELALEDGTVKTGELKWGNGSSAWSNTMINKPINLKGKYRMNWQTYSVVDESKNGTFKYVVNEIF